MQLMYVFFDLNMHFGVGVTNSLENTVCCFVWIFTIYYYSVVIVINLIVGASCIVNNMIDCSIVDGAIHFWIAPSFFIFIFQVSPWRTLLLRWSGSSGGESGWPRPRPSPAAGTYHFWPQNQSHSWPKHAREDNSWATIRGSVGGQGVTESNKAGSPPRWRRLDLFLTHLWDPGWPCDPPACWPCSSPPSGPVDGATALPSSRTRQTTWASEKSCQKVGVDLLVVCTAQRHCVMLLPLQAAH